MVSHRFEIPPAIKGLFCVCQAEVHYDKVSPEAEKSTSAENGVVQTEVLSSLHSHSSIAEADTHTHEDRSEKEEELEFPHDLLPSIDLSTELDLTWGASLRYVSSSFHALLFSVCYSVANKDIRVLNNMFQTGPDKGFLIAWNY